MSSVKIKDSILIDSVNDSIKIPIGNYELDDQPYSISLEQLKYHINSNLSTVATTGSFNDLTDKPDLNEYAKITTLNTNYYNKSEINSMIGSGGSGGSGNFSMEFMAKLPHKGETNKLYFVKSKYPENQNLYDEYVWDENSNTYEIISKSNYITKKEIDSILPSVYNSQITIKQGDVTKGTFSLNQSGNTTINIDSVKQSDWNQSDTSAVDYIKNKPTIPSNTRSLLITYEDETTEKIDVYTT